MSATAGDAAADTSAPPAVVAAVEAPATASPPAAAVPSAAAPEQKKKEETPDAQAEKQGEKPAAETADEAKPTEPKEEEPAAEAEAEIAEDLAPTTPKERATVTPERKSPKRKGSMDKKQKRSAAETSASSSRADKRSEANNASDEDGAAAESDSPKKPARKKTKTSGAKATPGVKRGPGRPRKIVPKEEESDESDSDGETNRQIEEAVEKLSPEITKRYGEIVWAKMVGFPYWPGLIADPRILNNHLQTMVHKELESKYMVYFYRTGDWAPILFKNVEAWDDAKSPYREGFPVKDAKAPKRRSKLMEAIELADKDISLPVDKRAGGILKVEEEDDEKKEKPKEKAPKAKKETKAKKDAVTPSTPEKRRPGRPLGSKNKVKTGEKAEKRDKSDKPKAKTAKRKKSEDKVEEPQEDVEEPSAEEVDSETTEATPLTKDEIKAKVASRKTPSKKKVVVDEAGSKPTSASAKASSKTSSKSKPSAPATKPEIDSKRKKEIELIVPRKSVKSSDIREMTEEASKKKLDRKRSKPESKYTGTYKVGDLGAYVDKLTQLQANESSKSNDELIQLLTQLFQEKKIYQSDAIKSRLPNIVSVLRKTTNPTVSKTASAIRKHLKKILTFDSETTDTTAPTKKQKVEEASVQKVEKTDPIKKQAGEDSSTQAAPNAKDDAKDAAVNEDDAKQPKESDTKITEDDKLADAATPVKAVEPEAVVAQKPDKAEIDVAKPEVTSVDKDPETPPKAEKASKQPEPAVLEEADEGKSSPVEGTPVVKTESSSAKDPSADTKAPTASVKVDTLKKTVVVETKKEIAPVSEVTKLKEEPPSSTDSPRFSPAAEGEGKSSGPCLDRNREVFIEMLSKALEANGPSHLDLAKEIEEFVFDRYKESNEEYKTQARMITFGLKRNLKLRERLFAGTLHGLELVYANDEFFA